MSTEFTLNAEVRSDLGKGASRRLRRNAGLVPAIVYGAGKDGQLISLNHNELQKYMKHETFYTQILSLNVAGSKEQVVIKDIQRHPFKPLVLHMDFLRIRKGEKVTMNIPFHFKGEEDAPGVKMDGGTLAHLVNEAEVTCLPADLPEFIEVDVSAMEMDQVLHLSEIPLAKGVEFASLAHENDLAVVNIHKARVVEEEPVAEASEEANSETKADDKKSDSEE